MLKNGLFNEIRHMYGVAFTHCPKCGRNDVTVWYHRTEQDCSCIDNNKCRTEHLHASCIGCCDWIIPVPNRRPKKFKIEEYCSQDKNYPPNMSIKEFMDRIRSFGYVRNVNCHTVHFHKLVINPKMKCYVKDSSGGFKPLEYGGGTHWHIDFEERVAFQWHCHSNASACSWFDTYKFNDPFEIVEPLLLASPISS
jgi:hypothetical protein